MEIESQAGHKWLQKLVGEWTFEGEAMMEPGQPPVKFKGTESVRPLGELWILAEGQGEMPGCGASATLMTLGYDPKRGRFVGTFVTSMMAYLWVYEGALDKAEQMLTLDTEGPDMAVEGKMCRMQDVIEIKSEDHRVLTSRMLGDDGQWLQFMEAHYRRRK